MVYNEFLETMKKQMELALGDGYSLTLRKVQKNNSLILDGLCIEKKRQSRSTFYLPESLL